MRIGGGGKGHNAVPALKKVTDWGGGGDSHTIFFPSQNIFLHKFTLWGGGASTT